MNQIPHLRAASFSMTLRATDTKRACQQTLTDTATVSATSAKSGRAVSSSKGKSYIRRPKNSSMNFRSDFEKKNRQQNEVNSQKKISKNAGVIWNYMAKIDKKPYQKRAKEEAKKHKLKYLPIKKSKIKGTPSNNGDSNSSVKSAVRSNISTAPVSKSVVDVCPKKIAKKSPVEPVAKSTPSSGERKVDINNKHQRNTKGSQLSEKNDTAAHSASTGRLDKNVRKRSFSACLPSTESGPVKNKKSTVINVGNEKVSSGNTGKSQKRRCLGSSEVVSPTRSVVKKEPSTINKNSTGKASKSEKRNHNNILNKKRRDKKRRDNQRDKLQTLRKLLSLPEASSVIKVLDACITKITDVNKNEQSGFNIKEDKDLYSDSVDGSILTIRQDIAKSGITESPLPADGTVNTQYESTSVLNISNDTDDGIKSNGDSTIPLPLVAEYEVVSHQTDFNPDCLSEDDHECLMKYVDEVLRADLLENFDEMTNELWLSDQDGEDLFNQL